jgi:peroxiredoxin
MAQLVELNSALRNVSTNDTEFLAVSVDGRDGMDKVAAKLTENGARLNLRLLSDPDHSVIDRYGLLNPESRGLPHPATYVIDKEGIVRWRQVDVDYRLRPKSEEVLKALQSLK